MAIGVVFAILLLILLGWRFRKVEKTFGSASWLTIFDAFKNGHFKKKGLLVGDWSGLLPVYYDGTHAITFGSAGSGKGTTAIIPNLLHAKHIFVNDPGGENAAVAIRQWRARDGQIYVINPFGLHADAPWALPQHSFNALDFLAAGAATLAADAEVLAKMLVPRTGRESGSSRYFLERAEAWIAGAIQHVMTTEPAGRRNLGALYDYANLDDAGRAALNAAMQRSPRVSAIATAFARMEEQAPEEFSAVLSTIQQSLQFLAEPNARAALCHSDVDFSALKTNAKGAVIALVLPIQYKESHAAISRIALQCAVWAMTRGAVSPHPVLFEIDEAASLGRIDAMPQWLAELRKYKIRWSLHFQNVGQPKHLYHAEWQTFQGNAGLKRFVGVADLETAKEAAEFCGRQTIKVVSRSPGGASVSQTGRELLTVEEVLRLKRHRQLVLIDNLKPVLLRKTPYWERPAFAGRYERNPYHRDTKGCGPLMPVKWVWGRLAYGAAWWLTPHPVAALLILIALGALAFHLAEGAPA